MTPQDMRPEYDIRGGQRGKYYKRGSWAPRLVYAALAVLSVGIWVYVVWAFYLL